jgi:hypothetical protein
MSMSVISLNDRIDYIYIHAYKIKKNNLFQALYGHVSFLVALDERIKRIKNL